MVLICSKLQELWRGEQDKVCCAFTTFASERKLNLPSVTKHPRRMKTWMRKILRDNGTEARYGMFKKEGLDVKILTLRGDVNADRWEAHDSQKLARHSIRRFGWSIYRDEFTGDEASDVPELAGRSEELARKHLGGSYPGMTITLLCPGANSRYRVTEVTGEPPDWL